MKSNSSPFVLSLDLGSSSVRAAVYEGSGKLVSGTLHTRPHQVRTTPDGGAELDSAPLLESTLTCLRESLKALGERGLRPDAVCLCTFWHSLLGVDAKAQPTTPVYMWSDTRSASAVESLKARLDEAECHRRTGCLFHTSYPAAKLLWLSEHDPEAFARARHWLSVGEYLALRLFGDRRCSHSMASGTGLYNHTTADWDTELLDFLPISRQQLSPVVDEREPFSGLRDRWRDAVGAAASVPWFPALGDGACSNVGSGGVTAERATLMIGTSGAMRVLGQEECDPTPGLWKYRVDRRRSLLGGALSNGGNLTWWVSKTLGLGDLPACEAALRELPPDGHGLTVLPFLAGERSPRWRPDATGAILGLRLSTEPVHLLQAMLEAVGYRFVLVAEALDVAVSGITEFVASGGELLSSPYWQQLLADLLNRPLVLSDEREASSRGAALLALEALGALPSIQDATFSFGPRRLPDARRHQRYLEGLQRHRQYYAQLAEVDHSAAT